MILDDQEYKKFSESRARLAFSCGMLLGTLVSTKQALSGDLPVDHALRLSLSNSISNALDEVSEILEAEFYPEWSKAPKTPPPPNA